MDCRGLGYTDVNSAITLVVIHILVLWIQAQICMEQICIYPKGVRQDSLM